MDIFSSPDQKLIRCCGSKLSKALRKFHYVTIVKLLPSRGAAANRMPFDVIIRLAMLIKQFFSLIAATATLAVFIQFRRPSSRPQPDSEQALRCHVDIEDAGMRRKVII